MHNEMDATAWSPQPYPPLETEYFEIFKKLIETIDSASLLLEGNRWRCLGHVCLSQLNFMSENMQKKLIETIDSASLLREKDNE